ncbi:hypothetical protein BN159_0177 [Streptomyces davaonensis JCM 4913]|uniref:Uncharacterized protein n=1 Tax=Streptomyces davaonensis (strain DSM 101723 / JCM 4913 / KCC S-0913 / 768) TaxID=1214101 RepID=K4QSF4_STRDJ|nr:DUF6668 family protein [Streptomyces davaonensis]CCK24556.1 hypothetical protein BN159_0177 [Streptomyces davaonensis JCM 4913]
MPPGAHAWVRGPTSAQPPSAAANNARLQPRPAVDRQEHGTGPVAPPPRRSQGPVERTGGKSVGPNGSPVTAIGWVQAHGGAGVTSLARCLGGVDVGARWPQPLRGEPSRVLLVGRTSLAGLQAVSRQLDALRQGKAPQGLDLLGVVLVADVPGRLPLTLLRRVRVIKSAVTVHRVPWIPSWRVGEPASEPPRQLTSLAAVASGTDIPSRRRR